jgi:L-arabinose isomerase
MKQREVWFVTGSQHLYGPEALERVAADSKRIAETLNAREEIRQPIVWKPTVTTPGEVYEVCRQANASEDCAGLIMWMHTFSPAKMWIAGLQCLTKAFVHLHTQFYRDIPWGEIDMDFMNLNQSAHGGREFGFICSRLRKNRAVIVGHYEDPEVVAELGVWTRAAAAWQESQQLKVARFGDNMREVAVTEGDKVEAQIKFGYSVSGYGIGDLLAYIDEVADAEVDALVEAYHAEYDVAGDVAPETVREAARQEAGMRAFL